ncbi:PREDICTED: uncharacterized protein LOC109149932 isoform X1 [Ipomoea nil]|uniref:uncharacterized protein LOC109149932 isoform X1 n=1 Tax=Ipomoea nil TaxID=35883 RepID=UPI00090165C6|nr:PREDICTED: uncharacterized protein LOC109149932 isoform X1 [Ipomoea nil]XP_019153472.1 PREDICTED: uncharacterized protein LOC109149932 isoform X1 [Ipomoea nil]XP_019153479.1 PREDICTED: uncharacterized protein LOC109149932 isoform X1 [Ipomoea nil]
MSLKLHHQSFVSSRCYARKTVRVRVSLLQKEYIDLSHILPDFRNHCINLRKSRKIKHLLPFASAEDGVTVNQSSKSCTSTEIEEMRMKLDLSLQSEDNSSGLLQSIHDAARLFELGIKQQGSLSRMPWFSTAWLGVDNTAWVKVLSYQASVYSLLQAANDVSSRGDGRDKDINVFIQQSVLKQTAPLESVIRDKLLAKQPEAYEWFWSEQIPTVVATFVNYFESDQRFVAATAVTGIGGVSSSPDNTSDVTLLMLVLSCIAAIIKLGPAKVSCVQFFSIIPDTLGRLMDMLTEYIPIEKAYNSLKNTGLHREFLVHFGPRAAVCNVRNDQEGNDEAAFWVGLIQKQLRQAIDRERIWSRLTTSESIEVLERDLAIFGFFIALGKTTQSFLSANGYDLLDEPIEGLIRYLIGGSILYYPQLSSISSYQLYVEVVCEELDWLPFYPGFSSNTKCKLEHRSKELPNSEAVLLVLDVCCYWTQSFIRYSRWLENPVNVKAARYVSTMHVKIKKCMTDLGIEKNHSGAYSRTENEPNSFDKAMESVEEALIRLEGLLKQLHMSRNSSGEHFKAACSDLEKIRRLKKEAEFLEASFSAMAASLEKGDTAARSSSLIKEQHQYSRGEDDINANNRDMSNRGHGLWSFLVRSQNKASDSSSPAPTENDGGRFKEAMADAGTIDSKTNEVQRFKILRSELMELERRVKRSADWNESEEEEIQMAAESVQLVPHQKKENIIGKSLEKLKETSTDVLQGTQLLAIDVAAAMELLRRAIIGDELTEKEKQALRRTLTDLASVIPIGFLMLLPVTAVGHAAMLAAIQRYVPALIPSTYGPERLALLRQLEKVKEMETEVNPNEKADE